MNQPWLWIAAIATILVVTRLPRILMAFTMWQCLGAKALEKLPDEIHLEPSSSAWIDNPAWSQALEALRQIGFGDAGSFTIPEMPGVVVRLLANEHDSLYCAMYEHPVAGRWTEFSCFFNDGTCATFSTLKSTGMNAPPGCVRVNAPGSTPEALYARALRERPGPTPLYATVATARQDFERNYAKLVAWRKQVGVSQAEVVKIAGHKAA